MAIDFFSAINFNKIPAKNFVFDNCTSLTHPANPVGGQVIYETDTGLYKVYNHIKATWESASAGMVFKGIVGGSSSGALANLPTTDVKIGDLYLVGADGDYGPSGATQHATKGDKFIATTESTSSSAPTWVLFDDNSKIVGQITIADGTTEYTITNTNGSEDLIVQLYDENNKLFLAEVEVSAANIKVIIDSSVATAEDGSVYKVVALNG